GDRTDVGSLSRRAEEPYLPRTATRTPPVRGKGCAHLTSSTCPKRLDLFRPIMRTPAMRRRPEYVVRIPADAPRARGPGATEKTGQGTHRRFPPRRRRSAIAHPCRAAEQDGDRARRRAVRPRARIRFRELACAQRPYRSPDARSAAPHRTLQ